LVGSSVKVDKFIFDYFEQILNSSDINRTNYIYDILTDCSYNSENNVFDKKMITLYFTDEQLDIIRLKQKELGYEDNFSKFIRYALFNVFMKKHGVILIDTKLIDYDKFTLLLDRCKDELINGEYTSYNTGLLRDNKQYEGKILFDSFNNFIKDAVFKLDFLECDMLGFLTGKFEKGKLYSEVEGLSTEQTMSKAFIKTEDEDLEPFTDYDNIVPDTDSSYYLFLYYAFIIDPGSLDIDEIFDETDEHIELLLKKYTFEKIIKYYEQKYNIIDVDKIFDKKCIKSLKSDNIIELKETTETEETKSDEVV